MTLSNDRLHDLTRFYDILDVLAERIGGPRVLAKCTGRMGWPERGVYFFQEYGETRSDSGAGLRIVRVGTHALKTGSRTTLWKRLSQHRGSATARVGNHRGSIFRLLVGTALSASHGVTVSTWGQGGFVPKRVREKERRLEQVVSTTIGQMPFLWLEVPDPPGPNSLRGYIERNAIALLSNYNKPALDAPSPSWLGTHCESEKVRACGLWNQNHVDGSYDPAFLDELERLVRKMEGTHEDRHPMRRQQGS